MMFIKLTEPTHAAIQELQVLLAVMMIINNLKKHASHALEELVLLSAAVIQNAEQAVGGYLLNIAVEEAPVTSLATSPVSL